jgi:adenylate cyclase
MEQRRELRLRRAFSRAQQRGLRLAVFVRLVVVVVVGTWLELAHRQSGVIWYLGSLAVFAGIGLTQLALLRWRPRPWQKYVFAAIDAALLSATLILPNPLLAQAPPPTIALRDDFFLYFFLLLVPTALTLTPFYVLWTGFVDALAWSIGVVWVISLPETHPMLTVGAFRALPLQQRLAAYMDPTFVDVVAWYQQLIIFLSVTAILALVVRRSRALVARQAAVERERGNLARYFSPNVVDRLADIDAPLDLARRQDVAVLFADIVGFTALAERLSPEASVRLLRAHYDRLADIVFAHDGTIDKYIGDALMAAFGMPDPGKDDATRALRAARAMLRSLEAWNVERLGRGEEPVHVGIGIDYGTVVLGNIGSERRLEITVIGDTVNVASRLERLTRAHGVDLVVSDDLVNAVKRESGPDAPELEGLYEGPLERLRGRDGPVRIWTLGRGLQRRLVAGTRQLQPQGG